PPRLHALWALRVMTLGATVGLAVACSTGPKQQNTANDGKPTKTTDRPSARAQTKSASTKSARQRDDSPSNATVGGSGATPGNRDPLSNSDNQGTASASPAGMPVANSPSSGLLAGLAG